MLEVIVDTNIIVRAIFQQQKYEDCWQILLLLRTGKITPVLSEELFREYFYATQKVILLAASDFIKGKNTNSESFIENSLKDAYDCACNLAQIMKFPKIVKVEKKLDLCKTDAEDNKIVDLAYNSNCHIVITANKSDFMYAEEIGVKTHKGEVIQFFEPELFLKCYEYMKRNDGFNNSSKQNKK